MKNNLKKKSLLLITIMLFSSFSLTALAATTAEGSYTTISLNGNSYKYNSSVTADTGSVWSHVHIYNPNYQNLPVGYLGANARLYNSSGSLIKSSG